MQLKKFLLGVCLAGLMGHTLAATEGVDYEVLAKPMPRIEKDKVEVLEFFGYFCIHCKNLDPIILQHTKTFARDTYFKTVHVVWEPDRDIGLARLSAAVEQSNMKKQANPMIFKAMFDDNVNLSDPGITTKWLNEQTTFNGKKVLAAYNAFGNPAQAKQMEERTVQYNIVSTPVVIVGGKYRLLFPKGFSDGMKTLDEMIDKVRSERGMKKLASKSAMPEAKRKGAGFAVNANR